jgi:hypothetical protein
MWEELLAGDPNMDATGTPTSSPEVDPPTSSTRPARKLEARLAWLGVADGDGFVTRPVESFAVDLEGIAVGGLAGDRHRGYARAADSRVPWYPRGTPIRNSRQVSIVSREELEAIRAALELRDLGPEEIGANMVLEGVPNLTRLPRGSRLVFPGLASLAVEDENAPCRLAGASVARRNPGRQGLDLAFVAAARHRRGLVAWTERPGTLAVGDTIEIRIPEQWLY